MASKAGDEVLRVLKPPHLSIKADTSTVLAPMKTSRSVFPVTVGKYGDMDHVTAHQELAIIALPDGMGQMRPREREGARLALIFTGFGLAEDSGYVMTRE
ncbi:uncharacterized protein ColSpa_10584 [Colletotrichum spaethianum]|uniref:Uncharacterized protein n=1 Tax=Colletotrichum spaethianum TaxID=700344 RepID=A0AA37USS4_9PEZI|nr:uncharacterized protein ColSpa_10584 [Colletotrichum spaethianum]GKT50403.1 hypothetical protein ColSpa_10584 [Colletotrichum spaethianum]